MVILQMKKDVPFSAVTNIDKNATSFSTTPVYFEQPKKGLKWQKLIFSTYCTVNLDLEKQKKTGAYKWEIKEVLGTSDLHRHKKLDISLEEEEK